MTVTLDTVPVMSDVSATVPEASGRVIARGAVGSVIFSSVMFVPPPVAPSNTILSVFRVMAPAPVGVVEPKVESVAVVAPLAVTVARVSASVEVTVSVLPEMAVEEIPAPTMVTSGYVDDV